MRLFRHTWGGALALALLAPAGLARDACAQQTGTVRGTVTDSASGRGIGSVQVAVQGTQRGAVTDDQGRYSIGGVAAGAATVNVQRLGFAPVRRTVTVGAGETVTLDVVLAAAEVAQGLERALDLGHSLL